MSLSSSFSRGLSSFCGPSNCRKSTRYLHNNNNNKLFKKKTKQKKNINFGICIALLAALGIERIKSVTPVTQQIFSHNRHSRTATFRSVKLRQQQARTKSQLIATAGSPSCNLMVSGNHALWFSNDATWFDESYELDLELEVYDV
jgi:hypothetical protein